MFVEYYFCFTELSSGGVMISALSYQTTESPSLIPPPPLDTLIGSAGR
jgi:hypothetical protein